jgi:hypothetical protein
MQRRGLSAERGHRRNAEVVATAASASSLAYESRLRRPEWRRCVLTWPMSLEMSRLSSPKRSRMCATRGRFVRRSQVRHRALRRLSWVKMIEPLVRVGDDHLAKADGITSAVDRRLIQREITDGTNSQVRGELRARTGRIRAPGLPAECEGFRPRRGATAPETSVARRGRRLPSNRSRPWIT